MRCWCRVVAAVVFILVLVVGVLPATARALAGGDVHMPTGPETWTYDDIEYCVANRPSPATPMARVGPSSSSTAPGWPPASPEPSG